MRSKSVEFSFLLNDIRLLTDPLLRFVKLLDFRTNIRYNILGCYHNGRRLVFFQRTVTSVYIEIRLRKSRNGGYAYAHYR